MPASLHDIISNTKDIYMTDSALDTLLDFERVLDELDLYAFAHWKDGELVEGPVYEKYFVTCTFMWPYKKMPDPRGGERLLDYDCAIRYKKDILQFPIKVKGPEDYEPGSKMPKLGQSPIWLVEIVMPKELMQEIETAYETGADDDVYKNEESQNAEQQPAAPAPAPAPAPV